MDELQAGPEFAFAVLPYSSHFFRHAKLRPTLQPPGSRHLAIRIHAQHFKQGCEVRVFETPDSVRHWQPLLSIAQATMRT